MTELDRLADIVARIRATERLTRDAAFLVDIADFGSISRLGFIADNLGDIANDLHGIGMELEVTEAAK